MSRLNNLLLEVKDKLNAIHNETISLKDRVVIAYSESDLLDLLKGLKSYPGVGIVFEGMRSYPDAGSTMKSGGAGEAVVALVLVDQGNATFAGDQRRARAVDYLEAMRDVFITKKSTTTGHMWHFMVEAPAALKSGMVVWVQRWSVPIQLIPPLPKLPPYPKPPLPEPPMSTPQLVYVAVTTLTHANESGYFGITVTYARPLKVEGTSPISLSLVSSNQALHGDIVIPCDLDQSTLDTTGIPAWEDFGIGGVAFFQLSLDLTGVGSLLFTCSNNSQKVGWEQLQDRDTGVPVPLLFDPPYYLPTFIVPPLSLLTTQGLGIPIPSRIPSF